MGRSKGKGQAKRPTQERIPSKKRKASEDLEEVVEQDQQTVEPFPPEEGCTVPRFSTKIHFYHRKFVVRVVLHKIPDVCITLEPTDEEFLLHTKKFSKKFFLKFTYPQRILVDAESCSAELDHGTLTCTFPITQILDKESGKTLRKKQKTTTESESGAANATEKPAPKKKQKKNKAAPKKDDIEEEKVKALALIDAVASKVDEKQKQKIDHEKAKEEFFKKKQSQKADKKQKKEELRQQSVTKVRQQQTEAAEEQKNEAKLRQKPAKASKVSFGEDVKESSDKPHASPRRKQNPQQKKQSPQGQQKKQSPQGQQTKKHNSQQQKQNPRNPKK